MDKPFLDLLRSRCPWVTRVITQTDRQTDRQPASCPQVKTAVDHHRSWGHRWCRSDSQKGRRRSLSIINLIPVGYLVLCLEMKQHFDLRTRCQLKWVCESPGAESAGFASLPPPTGILELPYWGVAGIPGKKREKRWTHSFSCQVHCCLGFLPALSLQSSSSNLKLV